MTGSPIGDALQRELGEAGHDVADAMRRLTHPHLFRHHTPQPAALAPIPPAQANPTEDYMSLLEEFDTVTDHIRQAAATVETWDRDAIAKAAAIKSTQAGAEALDLLHQVATATGAEPLLAIVTATLKGVAALAPQPVPQPIADAAAASDGQPQQ